MQHPTLQSGHPFCSGGAKALLINFSGTRQSADKTESRPCVDRFGPQNAKAYIYYESCVRNYSYYGAPPAKLAFSRSVACDIREGKYY